MTQQLTKIEPELPIVQTESAQLIDMIGRLASDPNSDIDKMERLMAMREKVLDREIKSAFNAALSDMQDAIPAIAERGSGHGSITYAKWEDVNKVIKPILKQYGFALRFEVDTKEGVSVTATLSHSCGFEVNTTMTSKADTSGSKNAIQAIGSSVSYLKRYTASALLNITSHGQDDDAYGTAPDDFDTTPWTADILEAKNKDELMVIAKKLKDEDMPHDSRTLLQGAWAGRLKDVTKEAAQ